MKTRVSLGPLGRVVVAGAKWTEHYPACQHYADELEELLAFAQTYGVFDEYRPRLQANHRQLLENDRQRDAALAEIRTARFFRLNDWPPRAGTWKPNGSADSDGEFQIEGPGGILIFVEVKHRDWRGELTEKEIENGRAKQPKHIDLEARCVALGGSIQGTIEKAYKKFNGESPSLLIVSNDLFVGLENEPHLHAGLALYATDRRSTMRLDGFRFPTPRAKQHPAVTSAKCETGFFTDSRFENLGGLGIFILKDDSYSQITYELRLYLNGFALPFARLPREFVTAFKGVRGWTDPTELDLNRANDAWIGGSTRLDRDKILRIIEAARGILKECFGVRDLRLFGSAARGENDPASDLDFVVELDPKTFANYMGLKEYLENVFGCRVDLVTEGAIKPALRENILSESVHAPGL